MIEEILPAAVASAEMFTDPPNATLLPQEAAIVERVSDKRRREFTAGRECARIALGKLGVVPVPILIGERGAPQWPPGIVGSITHCDGYRAAAVAHASDVAAIGMDAEPDDPLPARRPGRDLAPRRTRPAGGPRGGVASRVLGPAAVQRQGVGL